MSVKSEKTSVKEELSSPTRKPVKTHGEKKVEKKFNEIQKRNHVTVKEVKDALAADKAKKAEELETKNAPAAVVKSKTQQMKATKRKQNILKKKLHNPYTKNHWPNISKSSNTRIKEILKETFSELAISRAYQGRRGGHQTKSAKTESAGNLKPLSEHLIVGLNAVTKALERNQASLVIADRNVSPEELTDHIRTMCRRCSVPAVAIWDTVELKCLLGIYSLTVFAFKRSDEHQKIVKTVDQLVSMIPPLPAPSVAVPQVSSATVPQVSSVTVPQSSGKKRKRSGDNKTAAVDIPQPHTRCKRIYVKEPPLDIDYKLLYQHVSEETIQPDHVINADDELVFQPKQAQKCFEQQADFIALSQYDDDDDDTDKQSIHYGITRIGAVKNKNIRTNK